MFGYLSILNTISDGLDGLKSINGLSFPISSKRVTIGSHINDNIRIYDNLGSNEPEFQIELFNRCDNNIESNEFFVRLLKGKQFEINGKPFMIECRKVELRNNDRLTVGNKTFVLKKCRNLVKPVPSEPESYQPSKTDSEIESETKLVSSISQTQSNQKVGQFVDQTLTGPQNICSKDNSESDSCHQLKEIGVNNSESDSFDIKTNQTKFKQNSRQKSDESEESNVKQMIVSKRSGESKTGRPSKQQGITKTDEAVVITTSRRSRRTAAPTEIEAPVQQIQQKPEQQLTKSKRPLKPKLESCEAIIETKSVIRTSERNQRKGDVEQPIDETIETKLSQQNVIQTNQTKRKTNSTVDITKGGKDMTNKKRRGRAVKLEVDLPNLISKDTVKSKTLSKPINTRKRAQKPVKQSNEKTGPSLRPRHK